MSDRHEEIALSLFRESNDALFIFDPRDHRVLDANPVAQRLTGFDKRTLGSLSVWDLFQSGDPQILQQLIEAYQVSWFYHSREGLSLTRSGGAPIPVNVSVSRIHTRPDTLGLVVARDITERKQAQEALDRFFRLAPDLLAVFKSSHGETTFLQVNSSWESALGHPSEEILATSPMALVHPDDRPSTRAALESLRDGGEVNGFEHRLRHGDGTYHWLSLNAVFADGLIYAVLRDVTEEKRLATMHAAMERTELASRAKSELLRDLGHELRTPIAAILEYAEHLVRSVKEQPEQSGPAGMLDDLRTIRRNARYLVRLLGDLLDLARLESGTMRVDLSPCPVATVLSEVVDLLHGQARTRRVELSLTFRNPIPETIRSDGIRLRQILINLISNAIKFTPEGAVRVEAALDESALDSPLLLIDVIDNGPGMSAEVQQRLFTPFFRASSLGPEGAGLGLAISQRLAGLLGARITVRSKPEIGSQFTLVLPTGPIDAVARRLTPPDITQDTGEFAVDSSDAIPIAEAIRHAVVVPAVPDRSEVPFGHLRLLLVDDNRDLRNALTLRLTRFGADVVAVEDGARAVLAVERTKGGAGAFDLVLMDLRMAGMDGLEAARQIRAAGHRVPIIAMSASPDLEDFPPGLFDGVAPKPIDWEMLRRMIEERSGDREPPSGA